MSSKPKSESPEAARILWTISRRLAMVVVLALAFLLSATVTIYLLFRIGDTRVPAVVGKGAAEAQKMAEKAGLKVKIQRRGDPKIPQDTVIESRPAPNSSVKKDSSITIIVSSGASQTKSELQSTGEDKNSTGGRLAGAGQSWVLPSHSADLPAMADPIPCLTRLHL